MKGTRTQDQQQKSDNRTRIRLVYIYHTTLNDVLIEPLLRLEHLENQKVQTQFLTELK